MKTIHRILQGLALLALATLNLQPSNCFAQGTAFSYQGRLASGGNAATGLYDFNFALYNAASGGIQQGATFTTNAVPVTNGYFMVALDFGGAFGGSARWLDIAVKTNAASSYSPLAPRQPLTPAPYAIMANSASNLLGTLPVSQVSGVVPLAQLPVAVMTNNATGVTLSGNLSGNFGGSFFGNGGGLTNLNANNITSGTLPLAQLPAAVVTNGETGVNISGTFSGDGGGVTNLNSMNLEGPLNLQPSLADFAPLQIPGACDAAFLGKHMYLACGANGLRVFDASDLAAPVSINQLINGSTALSVAASGNYLYLGQNSGLGIYDVSSPANPVNLTTISGVSPQSLIVEGNYLYANLGNQLQIYDISSGSNATASASYSLSGSSISQMAVQNRKVYLAHGTADLAILNFTPGAGLNVVGSVYPGGNVNGVAVNGNYAYVATNSAGVTIYDVSNPAAPVRKNTFSANEGVVSAWIVERCLAVCCRGTSYSWGFPYTDYWLYYYDLSDPANPHLMNYANVVGESPYVSVKGDRGFAYALIPSDIYNPVVSSLYAASVPVLQVGDLSASSSVSARYFNGSGSGLTNLNASQLTFGMMPLAQLPAAVVTNGETGVNISGTFGGDGGGVTNLSSMNLAGPLNLQPRSTVIAYMHIPGARDAAFLGKYMYLACGANGLRVFDASDLAAPVSLNQLINGSTALSVAASGNYLYLGQNSGLGIYDVSSPANPVNLTTISGVSPQSLIVEGNYLYANLGNQLQIYDISSGSNATASASYSLSGSSISQMAVQNRKVYLAHGTADLAILNFTPGAGLNVVGSVYPGGNVNGVAVNGNYAYVAAYSAGVTIYDVSNPATPVLKKTFSIGEGAVSAWTVERCLAVCCRGTAYSWGFPYTVYSVYYCDLSDPANPQQMDLGSLDADSPYVSVRGTRGVAYAMAPSESLNHPVVNSLYAANVPVLQVANLSASSFVSAPYFIGSGYELTGLNANNITSGTLPLAQMPAAVVTNGATGANAVALGNNNTASGWASTVLGYNTTASGAASTALGLWTRASGDVSTALGSGTLASGPVAFAAGSNTLASGFGAVAMGVNTKANNDYSTAMGYSTTASGVGSTALGRYTTASGGYSTALGYSTTVSGNYSTALGIYTMASGNYSTALGYSTTASGFGSTALGFLPTASGNHSTAMGFNTLASGPVSFAAGSNTLASGFGAVAMGANTKATNDYSTALGYATTAGGVYSTVGGGAGNIASGAGAAVVGGGYDGSTINGNTASGPGSAIGGGTQNIASGSRSTVGGGHNNSATNWFATVPGGAWNIAGGWGSFAAGQAAKALHDGSFVWNDNVNGDFVSTANNQFLIHAIGNVGINKNNPATTLDVNGTVTANSLNVADGSGAGGAGGSMHVGGYTANGDPKLVNFGDGSYVYLGENGSDDTMELRAARFFFNVGNVGIGTNNPTQKFVVAGNIYATGTITPNSDRNLKTDFAVVDATAVLAQVVKLPIQQWRFKAEPQGVKHVGPMAQDFQSAFGLGEIPTAIATVDADGVALAAIQGLNQKLNEKDAEIQDLKARLEKLEQFLNVRNGGAK